MSTVNYRELAIKILEQIPVIMGVQPQPWPTNYINGRIMEDSWMTDELTAFLQKELDG